MDEREFYKLGKSNELLIITFQEELGKLEQSISDKIYASFINMAEIVFSALLTYCLDKNIDIFNFFPTVEEPSIFHQFVITIIPFAVIFITTIFLVRLLVKGFYGLFNVFRDTKKKNKDINFLKKYFYQKVLNEITMGVSLEKKAKELKALTQSSESEASTVPTQDQNLYKVYYYESLYYFQEALLSMSKKSMFEISNEKRVEYTNFLNQLNPYLVCQIFDMCLNSLSRIKENIEKEITQDIDDTIRLYNNNKSNVSEQIKFLKSDKI